jgi:hypothetical protein
MKRVRFSLRLLILLVSGASLLLGYSQYRRREIRAAAEDMRRIGQASALPDELFDRLWQRKPTVVVYRDSIHFIEHPRSQTDKHLNSILKRCDAWGMVDYR